jgi:hypothetical protein
MTEAELKKIAKKIAACLALANSSNPGEAEAAKRQAQKLLEKYNLTAADVDAASVKEALSKSGGKYKPPTYLCSLAAIIAKSFGCGSVFKTGGGYSASTTVFIGIGAKPDLAAYTFDVLRRLLNKAKTDYTATLKRYKPANRTRMAALFCEAWVWRISEQVADFSGTEQEKNAIAAYKANKWGDKLKTDNRAGAQPKKTSDHNAIVAGISAAADVKLHKPVQAKAAKKPALTDQRQPEKSKSATGSPATLPHLR